MPCLIRRRMGKGMMEDLFATLTEGVGQTRLRNERSTTGGFHCPLSRSPPAIPTARCRERNIKKTVIDRSFLTLPLRSSERRHEFVSPACSTQAAKDWFSPRRIRSRPLSATEMPTRTSAGCLLGSWRRSTMRILRHCNRAKDDRRSKAVTAERARPETSICCHGSARQLSPPASIAFASRSGRRWR